MKDGDKIETIWNKVKNLKYKTHDDKLGPTDKDYSQLKNARILTPEEVEQLGYGTCYDQANYIAYLADKLNLEYIVRFTLYSKNNEYTSHLCTYVKDIQGWYWIESAWSKMKGIHGPEKDINVFNKLADKEQGDFHLINENIDMANKLKPYWNDKRFTMDKFNDLTNKVSTEDAVSLEASGGNRKATEAFILNYITKILPTSKSVEIYKTLFKSMNDKAFDRWMCDLRDGKTGIVIIAPNFRGKHISVERNIKIGRELGHEFFQRLHVGPRGNIPGYLTPIKYFVVDLPVRRAAQSLVKKISISESNKGTDKLSGQLINTKDTKSARLTHPELQLLVSMGLDATLLELMKYRGGDAGGFRAMNLMISKYGHANLGVLNQYTTGVESTRTLASYLKAMHLKNNLSEK